MNSTVAGFACFGPPDLRAWHGGLPFSFPFPFAMIKRPSLLTGALRIFSF